MTKETAELIAELRAGLDGVTPGPWRHVCPDRGYCIDYIVTENPAAKDGQRHSDYIAETGNVTGPRGANFFEKDAAHIARCSPDNIRTLLDHIAALEARIAELETAGYGKPVIRRVERPPLVIEEDARSPISGGGT